jgi:hypothetical protein
MMGQGWRSPNDKVEESVAEYDGARNVFPRFSRRLEIVGISKRFGDFQPSPAFTREGWWRRRESSRLGEAKGRSPPARNAADSTTSGASPLCDSTGTGVDDDDGLSNEAALIPVFATS